MAQQTSDRVAANVRAELARRKITGREFALALGWPRSTAARRLNGTQAFDIDEIARVAEYLELDIATLIAA